MFKIIRQNLVVIRGVQTRIQYPILSLLHVENYQHVRAYVRRKSDLVYQTNLVGIYPCQVAYNARFRIEPILQN